VLSMCESQEMIDADRDDGLRQPNERSATRPSQGPALRQESMA